MNGGRATPASPRCRASASNAVAWSPDGGLIACAVGLRSQKSGFIAQLDAHGLSARSFFEIGWAGTSRLGYVEGESTSARLVLAFRGGLRVLDASDGQEAWRLDRTDSPDVPLDFDLIPEERLVVLFDRGGPRRRRWFHPLEIPGDERLHLDRRAARRRLHRRLQPGSRLLLGLNRGGTAAVPGRARMLGFLEFAIGLLISSSVVWDGFATIALTRSVAPMKRLSGRFNRWTWTIWSAVARRIASRGTRLSFLAIYGPISVMLLLAFWAGLMIVAFAMIYHGLGPRLRTESGPPGFGMLLYTSASAFLTLGIGPVTVADPIAEAFLLLEAGSGYVFLGLIISYMPMLEQAYGGARSATS